MELDEIPRVISVDDHVVEPPHVWERWLPAQYRYRGPKIVRRGIGAIDYVGTGTTGVAQGSIPAAGVAV